MSLPAPSPNPTPGAPEPQASAEIPASLSTNAAPAPADFTTANAAAALETKPAEEVAIEAGVTPADDLPPLLETPPPPEVSAPVASVEPPPPAEPPAQPIVFHGKTEEFFRIWIVNTLLTLLTLGVFFAWAKVRKRRYLRGSTELLGHRFDYRASPVRLLIGHVVVLALVLAYSLFGVVYPWVRFGVIGLAALLLPWIVVRSMGFNAHNTVYRGLRFRFNRSLSAATKVYLLEPAMLVLTLGLYYPAWQCSKRTYAITNHRFGDAYFRFTAKVGRFYSTYFIAGLLLVIAAIVGSVGMAILKNFTGEIENTYVQLVPFFVLYGFGFYLSKHLIYARLFNHVWNNTRLDEHRFHARLDTNKWLGLQLVNLGAILISAGMLYPWAHIRAQRYVASCLEFLPAGSIDQIQRLGGSSGNATSDMAAEFIGLDFGL